MIVMFCYLIGCFLFVVFVGHGFEKILMSLMIIFYCLLYLLLIALRVLCLLGIICLFLLNLCYYIFLFFQGILGCMCAMYIYVWVRKLSYLSRADSEFL